MKADALVESSQYSAALGIVKWLSALTNQTAKAFAGDILESARPDLDRQLNHKLNDTPTPGAVEPQLLLRSQLMETALLAHEVGHPDVAKEARDNYREAARLYHEVNVKCGDHAQVNAYVQMSHSLTRGLQHCGFELGAEMVCGLIRCSAGKALTQLSLLCPEEADLIKKLLPLLPQGGFRFGNPVASVHFI